MSLWRLVTRATFTPGPELELVAGDGRADHHADELRLDAVLGQRLLEDVAGRLHGRLVDLVAARAVQEVGAAAASTASPSPPGRARSRAARSPPARRARAAAPSACGARASRRRCGGVGASRRGRSGRRRPGRTARSAVRRGRAPPREKRLAPTRLAASTSASAGRPGGGRGALGGDPHRAPA